MSNDTDNQYSTLDGAGEREPPVDAPRLAYIEDDLVLAATFPGNDILPEVSFYYHPVNAIEDQDWANKVMGARGSRKELYRVVMKFVAKHLRSWDLKKAVKGEDGSQTFEVVNFKDTKELDRVAPAVIDFIRQTIQRSSEDVQILGKKSAGPFDLP